MSVPTDILQPLLGVPPSPHRIPSVISSVVLQYFFSISSVDHWNTTEELSWNAEGAPSRLPGGLIVDNSRREAPKYADNRLSYRDISRFCPSDGRFRPPGMDFPPFLPRAAPFCGAGNRTRRKFFAVARRCKTAISARRNAFLWKNILAYWKKVVSLHPLSPKKRRLKKSECYLKRMRRKR